MPRLLVFLCLVAANAVACRDQSSSTTSAASPDEIAAEVVAACDMFRAEYVPLVDVRGLHDFSTQRQLRLFRHLTKKNVGLRSDAAMRLLAHSECRSEGVLFASMRVSTLEGDYRTLIDLQEMVSESGIIESCPDPQQGDNDCGDDCGQGNDGDDHGQDGHDDDVGEEPVVVGAVLYGDEVRIAAAAGIGRILEADLPQPPGDPGPWHDNDTGHEHWDQGHHWHPPVELGVTSEMASKSIAALQIASCPGNPREVRSAAIEALGLARDPATRDFLELLFREAVEPDDQGANLFLRTLSGRSLTSITGNNHLADSDVDETLRLFLDAWNEQGGAP